MNFRLGLVTLMLLNVPVKILAADVVTTNLTSVDSTKPATLGIIDADSDENKTTITIRFDKKIEWEMPQLEDHGSFFQLVLPNTLVPKPGEFLEGNSPYIRKIAAFQITNEQGGLRFFAAKDSQAVIKATSIDRLADRIVLEIDHKKVEANLTPSGPSAAEVIEKTPVRNDIPDPAKTVQNNLKTKEQSTKSTLIGGLDLKNKFVTSAIFAIIFLAGLTFMVTGKNIARKRNSIRDNDPYAIKTLANHSLSPKQKITLVQIAGEKILLGISPDNISFLTTIDHRPKAPVNDNLLEGAVRNPIQVRSGASGLLGGPTSSATSALEKIKNLRKTSERSNFAEDVEEDSGVGMKSSFTRPVAPEEVKKIKKEAGRVPAEQVARKISFAVGDDGIKDLRKSKSTKAQAEQAASEDVTSLIRKKLKNFPQI